MVKTSEDCKKLIQPGLIKHLWSAAADCGDGGCFFILTPKRFGSSLVQDILVLNEFSCSQQTVLGYRPVDLTVGVSRSGADLEMYLVSSDRIQRGGETVRNTGRSLPLRRMSEERLINGALCLGRTR